MVAEQSIIIGGKLYRRGEELPTGNPVREEESRLEEDVRLKEEALPPLKAKKK